MAGNKGDVVYEIRSDDSQVEKDVEQANKKVEKAARKSSEEVVKIEEDKTRKIKAESEKAVKKVEKAADEAADAWKKSSKEVEAAVQDTGKKIEESLGGDDISTVAGNIGQALKGGFTDAAEGAIPLLDQIGALTQGLSGVQAVGVGVGAAIVGVGVAAVGIADDMNSAMNNFMAETGKGKEEAERYQNVLEDIYANNYGESFEDIAGAMAQVTKNMGEMDDASLQTVTESAFALRDTFEYDITESTRAAKAMMDNFGVSGEEAMSMIAAGAQNGLDYSGELLDSISEYSVQFSKVGLDADDMFNIFQKGADSGAFNLDKIGDAVKEMSIRVIDGSDTTKEGFKTLGLNADDMAAKFAAGGDTAKQAFQETIGALAAMEDPIEQNAAGVALFGTMWEDLGADAVTALADIEEGSYDAAGAMDGIKKVKYDDLGSMFEALKRNVELLLLPLGEALMPILMELIQAVLPIIQDLLVPLIDLFSEMLGPILELVSGAIQPLIEALLVLIESVLTPLLGILETVFMPVFQLVFDMIAAVVDVRIGEVTDVLKSLGEFIQNVFSGNWEDAWENIKNIFSTIFGDGIFSLAGHVRGIFTNLIDFIRNVFTGNWRGAWENVKEIFSNIVGAWVDIFKMPINKIIDCWNSLSDKLGAMEIPDWVPEVGGNTFSLPKLTRLRVGMDYVPSDDFPALLHQGEAVLTAEENRRLRAAGGLSGIEKMLSDVVANISSAATNRGASHPPESGGQLIRIEVPVNLDGREVARGTAEYVGEQLGWEDL